MYIYELSYGSSSDKNRTQLFHEQKFKKQTFEQMVLECAVECAQNKVHASEENIRKEKTQAIEIAMLNRTLGDEFLYEIAMVDCTNTPKTSFEYSYLHHDIVDLMVKKFKFTQLKTLHSMSFSTNISLNYENASKNTTLTLATRKLSKMICQNINKSKHARMNDVRAEIHNQRLHMTHEERDSHDKSLAESLGVVFVPYDHPAAVIARRELEN